MGKFRVVALASLPPTQSFCLDTFFSHLPEESSMAGDLIGKSINGNKKANKYNYGTIRQSTIKSLAGNDTIIANTIEDSALVLGTNNDSVTVSNLINTTIDGGAGVDVLRIVTLGLRFQFDAKTAFWQVDVAQNGGGFYTSLVKNIETIVQLSSISSKENIVYALVNPTATTKPQVKVTGTSANDTLVATDSGVDFQINSGAGDDIIEADILGKTTIDGGDGTDTVKVNSSRISAILLSPAGQWQIQGTDIFGNTDANKITTLVNVEKISRDSKVIYSLGTKGSVIDASSKSNNSIIGTQANDTINVHPDDTIGLQAGGSDVLLFTSKYFQASTATSRIDVLSFNKNNDKLDWTAFASAKSTGTLTYDADGFASGTLKVTLAPNIAFDLVFSKA